MNYPKKTPSHLFKFSCLSLLIGSMFVMYPNSAQAGWEWEMTITVTDQYGNTSTSTWEGDDSENLSERTCHLEYDSQTLVCSINSEKNQ